MWWLDRTLSGFHQHQIPWKCAYFAFLMLGESRKIYLQGMCIRPQITSEAGPACTVTIKFCLGIYAMKQIFNIESNLWAWCAHTMTKWNSWHSKYAYYWYEGGQWCYPQAFKFVRSRYPDVDGKKEKQISIALQLLRMFSPCLYHCRCSPTIETFTSVPKRMCRATTASTEG